MSYSRLFFTTYRMQDEVLSRGLDCVKALNVMVHLFGLVPDRTCQRAKQIIE